MDVNNIINYIFSTSALIISIVSIVQTNEREKSRKLKDSLMSELSVFYDSLRKFISCYTEDRKEANPQQIILTLKFYSVQFSAIKSVINEELDCKIQDLDIIEEKFYDIRKAMTDAVEFIKAVSKQQNVLFADITIKEIEELNADIYKCIMKSQYRINNSKVKRVCLHNCILVNYICKKHT